MCRFAFLISFLLIIINSNAQLVEVENNVTSGGTVVFGATNFAKTPVFLKVEFTELQNTTNDDIRIYYRKLEPGYNNLFSLLSANGRGAPYFYYKVKSYRSNPVANVDLDFPYLIPLQPGTTAQIFDVKNIDGFWGEEKLNSWYATGFKVNDGDKIYAARSGEIVEIIGNRRDEEPALWYNTWTNIITILQPNGTLISYKNVIDKDGKLKLNQKIFAGEILGEVALNTSEVVVLIYQHSIRDDDLLFIIPQFVTNVGEFEMLNKSMSYNVIHPTEVRAIEMTKKEKRKIPS